MLFRFTSVYKNYQDIEAPNLTKACLQLLTQSLCEHQAVENVYRYVSGDKDKRDSWKLIFIHKGDEIPFG